MSGALLVLWATSLLEVPVLTAVPEPREDFCESCCSLYCSANPQFTVSRSLASRGRSRFDAKTAVDSLANTAWVVEGNTGEWFQFTFLTGVGGPLSSDQGVNVLYILNGYARSQARWKEHNRIREVDLLVDGALSCRIHLLDESTPQRVDLPEIPLHDGLALKFVITAVFPGGRLNRTAISEIRLDGYGHH